VNEQTRQILQMLAEGKVTADEAERLIDALDRQELASPAGAEPRAKRRPKYLRVVLEDNSEAAPTHINVRVPLQLLRAGVRLTSLIPPRALTQLNAKLDESGVPVDLTQLRPQDIEELVDQLDDVTVDVDDPTSKIRVFCE
jgi:polyhydroxyalkanoate synthesis regulator phasin